MLQSQTETSCFYGCARAFHSRLKVLDDYIINYLDLYLGEYEKKLHLLHILLNEKEIDIEYNALRTLVDATKTKIELDSFEKQLKKDKLKPVSINQLNLMNGSDFEGF